MNPECLRFFCTKTMNPLLGMGSWIDCTWRPRMWLPVLGFLELRGLTENPELNPEHWGSGLLFTGNSLRHKSHFFQEQAFWMPWRDVAWIKSISNFLADVELLGFKEKERAGKREARGRGYLPTYCPRKHQQIQGWDIQWLPEGWPQLLLPGPGRVYQAGTPGKEGGLQSFPVVLLAWSMAGLELNMLFFF